jgi:hypothetical protein
VTPRELYELHDRLGRHRYELAQLAHVLDDLDLDELRADLQLAARCVRQLNSVVRLVGDVVAVSA